MYLLRLTVLFFFVAAAHAQAYRWIDEKGRVQYSDTPPPAGAKGVQKKRLQDNSVGGQGSYGLDKAMRESPVTLYSHPDCKQQCQIARDTLNKRGVPFREVVVETQETQDELRRVSGRINVPVLVVGAEVETAISAPAYERALDLAGYPRAGVARERNQVAPPSIDDKPVEPAQPAAETPKRGPYAPR
jgi:glutaredoxin